MGNLLYWGQRFMDVLMTFGEGLIFQPVKAYIDSLPIGSFWSQFLKFFVAPQAMNFSIAELVIGYGLISLVVFKIVKFFTK